MGIKKILTTIELLATTGIFSVGFSSWAIISGAQVDPTIAVNADSVIKTNDYIEIKNMIMSDYGSANGYRGFYTNWIYSEGTSNVAKVEFDIIFDYTNYFANFYSNTNELPSSINVGVSLGYSDSMANKYDIINKSASISNVYGIGYNANPSTIETTGLVENYTSYIYSNYNVNITETLKNSPLKIFFKYIYTFTVNIESSTTGLSASDYTALAQGIPFKVMVSIEENGGV